MLDPVELAETLVEAGLPVIEVTLRTEHSLAGMRKMATVKSGVGAGTVLTEQQLDQAIDAGATLAVSPGLLESLVEAANSAACPICRASRMRATS